jgi:hypothetical protein
MFNDVPKQLTTYLIILRISVVLLGRPKQVTTQKE